LQPALFATRFGVEEHSLNQRQRRALSAFPEASPAQTERDQASVNRVAHHGIGSAPNEPSVRWRLWEQTEALSQNDRAGQSERGSGAQYDPDYTNVSVTESSTQYPDFYNAKIEGKPAVSEI
jgi:hypothetical protein